MNRFTVKPLTGCGKSQTPQAAKNRNVIVRDTQRKSREKVYQDLPKVFQSDFLVDAVIALKWPHPSCIIHRDFTFDNFTWDINHAI